MAEFAALWPIKRFPVLVDGARTVVEASIIIEYLGLYHPGPAPLLPADARAALEVRSMDRFFDNYISTPQQRIVYDSLRPEPERDPRGVADARALLDTAYRWLDKVMAEREWAAGDTFSLADCGAGPFLFYADWTHPIDLGIRACAGLPPATAGEAVVRSRGRRSASVSAAIPAWRARPGLSGAHEQPRGHPRRVITRAPGWAADAAPRRARTSRRAPSRQQHFHPVNSTSKATSAHHS